MGKECLAICILARLSNINIGSLNLSGVNHIKSNAISNEQNGRIIQETMTAIGTTGREFLSKISMFCLLFAIISGVYSCKSLEHKQEYTQFDEITRKNVYIVVEEMPQYKGGEGVFLKELANNVQYVYSENDNLQTRVQVQFVIDKKGQLIGARIYGKESDAISDFEKAVLKALCQTNDWQAGRQNGKPVNVLLTKAINICPNH